MHISVSGVVGAPQLGQKLVALIGLAPQLGQISGIPISSLPQFLQNILTSFFQNFFTSAIKAFRKFSSVPAVKSCQTA